MTGGPVERPGDGDSVRVRHMAANEPAALLREPLDLDECAIALDAPVGRTRDHCFHSDLIEQRGEPALNLVAAFHEAALPFSQCSAREAWPARSAMIDCAKWTYELRTPLLRWPTMRRSPISSPGYMTRYCVQNEWRKRWGPASATLAILPRR